MLIHVILCAYLALIISLTWATLSCNDLKSIIKQTTKFMIWFILGIVSLGVIVFFIGKP